VDDSHALPARWDLETGTNVRWKTELAGLAHSSPVVWGDKVFVTSAARLEAEAELSSLYGSPGYGSGTSVADEGPHAFLVICLDKKSGEVLWERTAHEGIPQIKRHPKSSHANPTPAVDEKRVVAFFGSEGLYCYDHGGELQWQVDFGVLDCGAPRMEDHEQYQWGFASSPVLHGDKVIVQCDIQGQSFLALLDARNGEEIWKLVGGGDVPVPTPVVGGA